MPLAAADLARLSTLLDEALTLDPPALEVWLAGLRAADAAELGPTLRRLLPAQRATPATSDLLERGPAFAPSFEPDDAAAPGFKPGDTVGPYRLLRELGRGGMGEVWLAERQDHGDGGPRRRVALKLPTLPLLAHRRELLLQRFERERDIVAGLAHPNIARLYDAGVDAQGQPWLALEYVQGVPITEHARREKLPLAARIGLLLQVAEAVSHAHGQLVLHRDLKPGNILVTPQGQVRLLDFGIAKLLDAEAAPEGTASTPSAHPGAHPSASPAATLTHAAGRALTPDYASPEQIRGEPLGTSSDQYSLGVVAYELLTGVRPYRLQRGSAAELEEAILQADPLPPSSAAMGAEGEDAAAGAQLRHALRGDLDAILLQALRKQPGDRYGTVEALAADLRRHLRGEPVLARKLTRRYLFGRFVARHRTGVLLSGAALAMLLGASSLVAWQAHHARLEAARANQEAVRAQAVQRFLLELLQLNSTDYADPQAMQRTTVRQMLDIGAARVDELLKDAPHTRIEVMRTLADLYIQLGERKTATDLRQRRLALARRTLAADDPRLAAAMLDVSFSLVDGPKRAEAARLLGEAGQVLDAAGDRDSVTRAQWLTQWLRYQRYESLDGYLRSAEAALAFHRRLTGEERAVVRIHYFVAQAHALAADWTRAISTLQEARPFADRHGGGGLLVMAVADMGDLQFGRGDFGAADKAYREAVAAGLKVYGQRHRSALVFRIKLAEFLYLTGRTEEATRLESEVRLVIAEEGERLESWWRSYAETLMTGSLAERGRPDRSLGLVRSSVAELQRELPGSGSLALGRLQLAELLIATGVLDEAEGELAQAAREWTAYAGTAAQPTAMNSFHFAYAELMLARGQIRAALTRLDQVVVPTAGAGWNQALVRRELLRGQLLLMQGETARAAAAASAALDAATSVNPNRPHWEARARWLLARVLSQQGDRVAARAQLQQALALRQRHDAEGSRELVLLREAIERL